MILLNTNVISDPLRKTSEMRVVTWIDAQPIETLYLSTVTVAELRLGIEMLRLVGAGISSMRIWKTVRCPYLSGGCRFCHWQGGWLHRSDCCCQ